MSWVNLEWMKGSLHMNVGLSIYRGFVIFGGFIGGFIGGFHVETRKHVRVIKYFCKGL